MRHESIHPVDAEDEWLRETAPARQIIRAATIAAERAEKAGVVDSWEDHFLEGQELLEPEPIKLVISAAENIIDASRAMFAATLEHSRVRNETHPEGAGETGGG